jgi:hypothetical protein
MKENTRKMIVNVVPCCFDLGVMSAKKNHDASHKLDKSTGQADFFAR